MKIELLIVAFTVFFVLNVYYDNALLDKLKGYKKYGQMLMYGFVGLSLYLIVKKDPNQTQSMLSQASNFVKYLPIDRNASQMLTPILNFSGTSSDVQNNYNPYAQIQGQQQLTPRQQRIITSGRNSTKRSVSETKKKWVASQQNWACAHCKNKLPAWFEVDHKLRLEYGGTNEVNNLEALCRDCHGRKTASENL